MSTNGPDPAAAATSATGPDPCTPVGAFSITGYTYSHDGVARLLAALRDPHLENVKLGSSVVENRASGRSSSFDQRRPAEGAGDVVTKQRIPKPAAIALVVVALLVVAALGYFVVISPKRSASADLAVQIEATETEIQNRRLAVRSAPKAEPIRAADLFRVTKAMPGKPDMPGVLLELNRIARDRDPLRLDHPGRQRGRRRVHATADRRDLRRQLLRALRLPLPRSDTRLREQRAPPGDRTALHRQDAELRRGEQGFPQIRATLGVDAYVYGTGAATPPARRRRPPSRPLQPPAHRPTSCPAPAAPRQQARAPPEPEPPDGKFDPKAKAKRQKIIAGVLGLVLVGVLIFQAPKILSMFGGGSSTTAEPAATPAAPAAPAPATPGAPAPATPAPAATGTPSLVDSDPAPVPSDGQLVTFDRFESKDVRPPGDRRPGRPGVGAERARRRRREDRQSRSSRTAVAGATSSPQPAPQQVSNTARSP